MTYSPSLFRLNVADLLGRDASPRRETIIAEVDWGIDGSSVQLDPPMEAELVLHPVSGGIAVTGNVEFTTKDTCFRCLDTVLVDRRTSIGALFDTNEDEETYPLDGHDIDVEQLLRDEVVLSLPIAPSCSDDCPGIVTSAGTDLNTEPSGDGDDSRSPFAVLKDLLEPED